MCWTVDT